MKHFKFQTPCWKPILVSSPNVNQSSNFACFFYFLYFAGAAKSAQRLSCNQKDVLCSHHQQQFVCTVQARRELSLIRLPFPFPPCTCTASELGVSSNTCQVLSQAYLFYLMCVCVCHTFSFPLYQWDSKIFSCERSKYSLVRGQNILLWEVTNILI